MDSSTGGTLGVKTDDEKFRHTKRVRLRELNATTVIEENAKLDSSLRRHTALIKRIRQSMASDNREQIMKDIDSLTLEKYIDELAGAIVEGLGRCKTEKDIWGAVEITSALHRRFPKTFTPALISNLAVAISAPSRAALASLTPEQREKEDSARVVRQRPIVRVCSELALVGIIRDSSERSGGEWVMKAMKELLSNDPSLSSLPLLTTFLKSYSRPFLGIAPPTQSKQISISAEPGSLTSAEANGADESTQTLPVNEEDELVERDIRDRFKRMCEGYFDNVCKKLVIEHKRLQEQDRRNHEAYIRSGEIFEDRQQAYEKMTKTYEKLLASCQSLSELLYLPLPSLPTVSQKSDSILIGSNSNQVNGDSEEILTTGGKWEDEEERRFYEDVQDLKDFVPSSVLGVEVAAEGEDSKEAEQERVDREKEEVRKLEEELENLSVNDGQGTNSKDSDALEEDDIPTPTPGTPRAQSPPLSPQLAPQGPSQLLTALLVRLPDATNRALIDQAAIDFAFLNSKAARKRLVKFMSQVQKNRTDLLPHYSRLIATLNRYMPDIGTDIIAFLDEEFRYLQRKKNVVKELAEVRLKNILFLSNLTKFRVVPSHVILHIFKVCLDDFSGTNVENIALLLEGCGRFLLRSEETSERFSTMLELMRRKQNMQHFDQRQLLLLENAYYQCNPPERGPKQEKIRTPMELFIRHLIYDVLAKKSIDKVLKLLRKLDWDNDDVKRFLHKVFTKPWKIKYGNIGLLAMLTYDLQRYRPAFAIAVVDQVLEDIRRGLEQNVYSTNQRRLASMKYLGELYIYRLLSSSIVFDMLWSIVTFGHPEGRPLPGQAIPLDMPDDFFRVRLVCVLLDTCGMCFDRGTQKKKLDNFLTFFQYYIHCKEPLPMDVDFMVSDSLEAVRPKLEITKTLEQAAIAVDEMFNSAYQTVGEDSGEDSDEEGERRDEGEGEDDDGEEEGDTDIPMEDRPASPDQEVVLSASNSHQENLGPSEEADADFAKELAKLVTDTSAESRKVDKKTALALWDSAVLPPTIRKKRAEDKEGEEEHNGGPSEASTMAFTVLTKKGNKQGSRQIAVPAASALAVHTRSAQLQDKVEQQHLKRLVLNYEQREEAEELKADEIGKGKRGNVYLGQDQNTGLQVAVKAVKRVQASDRFQLLRKNRREGHNSTMNSVHKEIAVMRRCRHPNIVRLLEVLDDPDDEKIYLIMEYLPGGEVQWNRQEEPILSLRQIQRIMRDVILGLEYLHSQGIIHRDIKPANVVYTEDRHTVKLIDFGIAHYTPPASEGVDPSSPFSEKDLTRRLGTPSFLSPEVAWWPAQDSDLSSLPSYASHLQESATNPKTLQVPPKQPPVTTAVDIWALGVTLYCFLFGVLPFKVSPTENDNAYRTEYALYLIIMALEWYPGEYIASNQIPTAGRYPPKSHNTFPVIHLLDRMLQKDPGNRISLQEVKSYPWIHEGIEDPAEWAHFCSLGPLEKSSSSSSWIKNAKQKFLGLMPGSN
ncbi:hypothetical protein D9619_001892 [Psilocybe cf. subviscida]|uniref:Protein kinase domain-containing protein n=1 Tax=Psilocybe cf. subviscida TaxID=2480587 RepID=A0A8H5F2C3_9AGAR|nr:hypothetical protein D9619_001892 [Psilocybe cf. subviscida]